MLAIDYTESRKRELNRDAQKRFRMKKKEQRIASDARECPECGTSLKDKRADAQYCGLSCQLKAYRRRKREKEGKPKRKVGRPRKDQR